MLVDLQGAPLRTDRYWALIRTLSEWVSDERVFDAMVREMGQDDAALVAAAVGCSLMDPEQVDAVLEPDQLRFLVRALLLRKGRRLGDEPADKVSTGALRRAIIKHERRSGAESLREAVSVVLAVERLAGEN